jgi:hypothetical protein
VVSIPNRRGPALARPLGPRRRNRSTRAVLRGLQPGCLREVAAVGWGSAQLPERSRNAATCSPYWRAGDERHFLPADQRCRCRKYHALSQTWAKRPRVTEPADSDAMRHVPACAAHAVRCAAARRARASRARRAPVGASSRARHRPQRNPAAGALALAPGAPLDAPARRHLGSRAPGANGALMPPRGGWEVSLLSATDVCSSQNLCGPARPVFSAWRKLDAKIDSSLRRRGPAGLGRMDAPTWAART